MFKKFDKQHIQSRNNEQKKNFRHDYFEEFTSR